MEKEQAMLGTESIHVKTSPTEGEKSTLEAVGNIENEHHLDS